MAQGKWFPVKVNLQAIEMRENQKLDEMAEYICGRIACVAGSLPNGDYFPIKFEPFIRDETIIAFMTEFIAAIPTMEASERFAIACYVRPEKNVFIVEMKKKGG